MPCGQGDGSAGVATAASGAGSLDDVAIGCGDALAADLGRSVAGVFELHATTRNAANDFFTTTK
jgi:hypothetical protein